MYNLKAFGRNIYENSYLVISLKELEFIPYQENMVNENHIPNFLEFHTKTEEGEPFVYYKINGYKKLTDVFGDVRIPKNMYLQLIESVANAMLCRENYFLSDNSLIIHQDFIYINGDDIRLVYVPAELKTDSKLAFERFITYLSLMLDINQVGAGDIAIRFQNLVNSPKYTLKDFKEIISSINRTEPRPVEKAPPQPELYVNSIPVAPRTIAAPPPQVELPVKSSLEIPAVHKEATPLDNNASAKKKGLFGGIFGKRDPEPSKEAKPKKEKTPKVKNKKDKKNKELNDIDIMAIPGMDNRAVKPMENKAPVSEITQLQNLNMETEFLLDDETQIVLRRDAYLAFCENGVETKRILIHSSPFIIGRQQNTVHYYIDDKSVSRKHAEIISDRGSFYILDDTSKGGTFVNSIKLTPGQLTPLQSGDRIGFCKSEHIFYTA